MSRSLLTPIVLPIWSVTHVTDLGANLHCAGKLALIVVEIKVKFVKLSCKNI